MTKSGFFNNLTDRYMAVTDGVFAIAMTILVLEIAVPTMADMSSGGVVSDYIFNSLAPSIFIYFISFYLVYNFWENTVLLFNFKKISYTILVLNMISMAVVCLIPFATGFLFKFYHYISVNIFFSLLILVISLLYLLMFILLIRNNFGEYFEKKEEIRATFHETYGVGIELPNLKLYVKGVLLTLFYILMAPVICSLISIVLAFISPVLSLLSFLLILVLGFIIRMRRGRKDNLDDVNLNDDEREVIGDIKKSIYGE